MAFDSISPIRLTSVHDVVRRAEPRADELPADRTQSLDPRTATDPRATPAAAGDKSANLSDRDDHDERRNRLTAEPELGDDERREVEDLRRRDREVRRHEQAHQAAAGSYARGGPSYEFVSGPDGGQYAVGGDVQIDTSAVDDPRAAIQKFETVHRAALAPADPSSQDLQVAAVAQQEIAKARSDLAEDRSEESGESEESDGPSRREDRLAPTGRLVDRLA